MRTATPSPPAVSVRPRGRTGTAPAPRGRREGHATGAWEQFGRSDPHDREPVENTVENFRANRYGNIRRALLHNQLRCLSEKLRFPRHRNGNRWKTPFPDTPGIHLAAQIRRKIKKRKKPHLREEKKGTSPFLPPHTARFPDRWMKGHGPATYPPCRASRTMTATPKPPPPTTGWLDLRQ